MANRVDNLRIENARLIFRNLEGRADRYNKAGKKTFGVVIEDEETAEQLRRDGWNVKVRPPREEGDAPRYHIPVEARYDNYPPKIYIVTDKAKVLQDEENLRNLDYAELENVDLTLTPSVWTDDEGVQHVKAYLKNMYVTIEKDEFADKYEGLEEM